MDSFFKSERSSSPASTAATRQGVTATSVEVRMPPSREARSPEQRARAVLKPFPVSFDPGDTVQDQIDVGPRLTLLDEGGARWDLLDSRLSPAVHHLRR